MVLVLAKKFFIKKRQSAGNTPTCTSEPSHAMDITNDLGKCSVCGNFRHYMGLASCSMCNARFCIDSGCCTDTAVNEDDLVAVDSDGVDSFDDDAVICSECIEELLYKEQKIYTRDQILDYVLENGCAPKTPIDSVRAVMGDESNSDRIRLGCVSCMTQRCEMTHLLRETTRDIAPCWMLRPKVYTSKCCMCSCESMLEEEAGNAFDEKREPRIDKSISVCKLCKEPISCELQRIYDAIVLDNLSDEEDAKAHAEKHRMSNPESPNPKRAKSRE